MKITKQALIKLIEEEVSEGLVLKNPITEDVDRCNLILKRYGYKVVVIRGDGLGEIPELDIERLDFH